MQSLLKDVRRALEDSVQECALAKAGAVEVAGLRDQLASCRWAQVVPYSYTETCTVQPSYWPSATGQNPFWRRSATGHNPRACISSWQRAGLPYSCYD